MRRFPDKDVVSWNSIIKACIQCGDFLTARSLFDEMPSRTPVSWTTLIDGLLRFGKVEDAGALFWEMPTEVRDVPATLPMAELIMLYGCLFHQMPLRDVISWTSIIAGLDRNGRSEQALVLFQSMVASGVNPSSTTLIITKMSAANGARRVWVGQNGLLSTPAVSAVIRERVGVDGSKATGAFILTASHNPGGPEEDFGIKYNMENGGPAPEGITDKIYENTTTIKEYFSAEDLPDVDITKVGVTNFTGPEGPFDVEVFDSASDYIKLMKSIFDFESIRKLLSSPKFTFCFDGLHGVAGAYAKSIFVDELGTQESSLLNCTLKEDFGGGHPDPNLTYAKELVARMGLGKSEPQDEPPEFGAAADGDADRNMILGKRFFVTPSDSVAIIATNAVEAIPYFSAGLKGDFKF
ncbi:phosphoglucomutase, cytoplasmic-like isoform X2 [Lotus japonicus]|uniref:phosphoglucomutase, cytoplasmic-like isoform X2 n=1 Tax=Lotus japonicus TaxID=34305 RepID=UPI0025842900|nr:phosphoglucomutase, cytoplasmic-like isoform X2 [Lotus japonicus]